MECPTCGSDMVLMRTVTQDEVIELDKYGADVDMSIETHTLRAENERFICTANENDHTITGVDLGGIYYWAGPVQGSYHWDGVPATVRVTIPDEPERGTITISRALVARGIAAIKRPEFEVRRDIVATILLAEREEDAGDIDEEIADVIIQAGIFGEIVYG